MDSAPLAGELFLYALATISITFVGFSALLIVFRQTMGGKLTPYDTYFTLSFIQIGFIDQIPGPQRRMAIKLRYVLPCLRGIKTWTR